jgi:hypothetical protein
MHVSFTGTSESVKMPQLDRLNEELRILRDKGFEWLHHGDCINADADAHRIWQALGGKIWLHPPDNDKKRAYCELQMGDCSEPELPYSIRNQYIVKRGRRLLACPGTMTEITRSGSWSTIRYARKLYRNIKIILPNGQVRMEGVEW